MRKKIVKNEKVRSFNCELASIRTFKACVRYFSLFIKEKWIEKKFNLQLFFVPFVS